MHEWKRSASGRMRSTAGSVMSVKEEDTCMSYEEEDTCMSYERRIHACHMRRRIHACHMRGGYLHVI
jgi:hypothetical protein